MESWMFLSSYEKFRAELLTNNYIQNLIHMPYLGKGGTSMGINFGTAAFVIEKTMPADHPGVYQCIRYYELNDKKEPIEFPLKNERFNTARQRDFGKIPGSPLGYWLSEKFIKMVNSEKKMGDMCFCSEGVKTSNNARFLRYLFELESNSISNKWQLHYKGGAFRRWAGNLEHCIFWQNGGELLKNIKSAGIQGEQTFSQLGFTWSDVTSGKISFRVKEASYLFDSAAPAGYYLTEDLYINLGFLNTKIVQLLSKIYNPTLHFKVGNFRNIPYPESRDSIHYLSLDCVNTSTHEWDSREIAWDFKKNELFHHKEQDLKKTYDKYKTYWTEKFHQLHRNEEALNQQFIEIYGLEEELSPDVPLADITILQQELDQKKLDALSADYQSGWQLQEGKWILEQQRPYPDLPFDQQEVMAQFVSYAVGAMFGRYALDKEGLILANQAEGVADFVRLVTGEWWVVDGEGKWSIDPDRVDGEWGVVDGNEVGSESPKNHTPTTIHQPPKTTHQKPSTKHHPPLTFWPDEDNIIPVLDEEWFEDDIVSRFRAFLRASFGEEHFHDNLAFLEECLGTDIRSWFVKKFYPDHIKRYKKRPIYWLMASPSGAFQALIYLHRYTPDTMNHLLNDYLRVYMDKLRLRLQELAQVEVDPRASAGEQSRARKQMDQYKAVLDELETWEREVIYPLASERIAIDLDDGVLVNYNKFGRAVQEVRGLNDAKTKKKVRGFDWIDTSGIR
jgi:hypothetical protein